MFVLDWQPHRLEFKDLLKSAVRSGGDIDIDLAEL